MDQIVLCQTDLCLSLRVKATSQNGEDAQKDAGVVTKLIRFTGTARYGGRDEAVGGDDWAKPQVASFVNGAGLTWGDFSNMNGGPFAPHHLHQTGNSADGWFSGYNARNAATAATIIDHLNTYGERITTVEGLSPDDGELTPLQQAFSAHHALQCGYCTPGMLISATHLLERNPRPSEEEIRRGIQGNICRCTGYVNIVKAIQSVAQGEVTE